MSAIRIDARGLSCPQPVLEVRKVMAENPAEGIDVLLDSDCSVENVSRLAGREGWTVEEGREGADWILRLRRG